MILSNENFNNLIKIYLDNEDLHTIFKTYLYFRDKYYLVYEYGGNYKEQFRIEFECVKNQYLYGCADEYDELVLNDFINVIKKMI